MGKRMSARALLLAAARLLARKGWCQGQLFKQGRYCAIGALNQAATGSWVHPWDEPPVLPIARGRLRAVINDEIVEWNNARGRKKQHVIAALRKAARLTPPTQGRAQEAAADPSPLGASGPTAPGPVGR